MKKIIIFVIYIFSFIFIDRALAVDGIPFGLNWGVSQTKVEKILKEKNI